MSFSHNEIKVFYSTNLELQPLFLLPKYWFLIASYFCFLEGLINILTTSLRKTIYLCILCLTGWKHSSRKQLSRHDDNKPSVAGMAGKEVALSKQYFPKKSWAVCQAVVRLNNYFRYSFFIRSLKYNFLMQNTLMNYGSIYFFPWMKLYSVERAKMYVTPVNARTGGNASSSPHLCHAMIL